MRKGLIAYSARQGYVAPLCMVTIGLFILFTVPLTDKGLHKQTGRLTKFYKSSYSKFKISGVKDAFMVQNKNNKAILKSELPDAKQLEVWTKKVSFKKGLVMQLKVDGRMVIEYSWWQHAKAPLVFMAIGLVLLPFVRREWKEMKRKGEV